MSITLDFAERYEQRIAELWDFACEMVIEEFSPEECARLRAEQRSHEVTCRWLLEHWPETDWLHRSQFAPYIHFALECRALDVLDRATVEWGTEDRKERLVFIRPVA